MPAASRIGELRPSAPTTSDAATRRPSLKRQPRLRGVELDLLDRARRVEREARQRLGAGLQRAAQQAVLDDIAERLGVDLGAVVMKEERRIAVGDADLADRLRMGASASHTPMPFSTCCEP